MTNLYDEINHDVELMCKMYGVPKELVKGFEYQPTNRDIMLAATEQVMLSGFQPIVVWVRARYKRVPRKLKKQLKKNGEDWRLSLL